ncbi:hypothetical protein [Mucilaginibacter sp. OK268]|uniref:hypothetical protein n=1 Tax=Mucilaginibacter sp. OK268 TaxID=1881048 RepID=UPI00115FC2F1|nr:hypothetical protein [Mucilaginibacter sp. OK268]
MKTRKEILKKYIVLSLLVVFQAVSLLHIVFQPRFYTSNYQRLSSSSIDLLHKNHSAGNARILFQRGIENNRKALITPPNKTFALILSFFLGSLISLTLVKKRNTYLSQPGIRSTNSYLSLCTLRI